MYWQIGIFHMYSWHHCVLCIEILHMLPMVFEILQWRWRWCQLFISWWNFNEKNWIFFDRQKFKSRQKLYSPHQLLAGELRWIDPTFFSISRFLNLFGVCFASQSNYWFKGVRLSILILNLLDDKVNKKFQLISFYLLQSHSLITNWIE